MTVQETIRHRDRPYFVRDGNVRALLAARQISIHEDEPINAAALLAMLAQIIANNRAGGWRGLKADAAGGRVENP